MKEDKAILRIKIDGRWSAEEMSVSIGNLEDLYILAYGIKARTSESDFMRLTQFQNAFDEGLRVLSDKHLELQRIQESGHHEIPYINTHTVNEVIFNLSPNIAPLKVDIHPLVQKHFASSLFKPNLSSINNFEKDIEECIKEFVSRASTELIQKINDGVNNYVNEVFIRYRETLNEIIDNSNLDIYQTLDKLRQISQNSSPSIYPIKDIVSIPLAHKMQVHAIKYESPGFKDLIGIGDVIGHVKDFLLKIIEHSSSKKKRKIEEERMLLENERLQLENQKLLLETTKEYCDLFRENGYQEDELKPLIVSWLAPKQDFFTSLTGAEKILSAELIPLNETTNS